VADQGKTLRFIAPQQMRPDGEELAKFIKQGHWAEIPAWSSSYGPGGERSVVLTCLKNQCRALMFRQWLVEQYISFFDLFGTRLGKIPPVVWLTLSGVVGKLMMEKIWSPKPNQAQAKSPNAARAHEARRNALRQAAAQIAKKE
jgi:hypothetical protein